MHTPRLHAQLTTCPRCNSAILTALDHPVAGLTTRVDPLPLTAEDELSARLAGRLTYNLIGSPLLARYQLHTRDETNIHKRPHPVVATHTCPGPIPATAIPPPPPAEGELDLFNYHDEPPEGFPF